MKATIGRIVHFYDYTRPRDASGKAGPFAAIVTADGDDDRVSLTVFPAGYPPISVFNVAHEDVPHHDGQFWTWPPREVS